MPVKSALSQFRRRISFNFFKDYFGSSILEFEKHRRTWRGLKVYATDGDQYELPASENVLARGYRGHPQAFNRETHYPRMYVVNTYDVLSGVTKDFRYSTNSSEVHTSLEIVMDLEPESLTLYDRMFFCKNLISAHRGSKNYFLARCKRGKTFQAVIDLMKSSSKSGFFEFEGVRVNLIKFINPKTGEADVFATNLPRDRFRNEELFKLYTLRWEIETSHKDFTHTMKMEQWHSNCLNGILQEIYMGLWLMNQVRIQMALQKVKNCTLDDLMDYTKSNFKLIIDFFLNSLEDLLHRRISRVSRRLKILLERSKEKRKRLSRSYPRQIKKATKLYLNATNVSRRT